MTGAAQLEVSFSATARKEGTLAGPPLVASPLRIELASRGTAGRASGLDSFVVLDRDRFSQTLLANVFGPNGGLVRQVALRIQNDEYSLRELASWSNAAIETYWAELRRLWQATAAEGAAPAVLDLIPGDPPRLAPTLYCRKQQVCIPVLCSECQSPLQTCRDDELLTRHGLAPFHSSLERYLYCESCALAKYEHFFALIPPVASGDASGQLVGDLSRLYAGLGKLVHDGGARLPCTSCTNQDLCFPASPGEIGEAEVHLVPISFHDANCIAFEPPDLTYEAFCAWLGGRTVGVLDDNVGRRKFLFEEDPAKLSVELFRAKLLLFRDLVGAVSRHHRATRRPHLALSPEHVWIRRSAEPNQFDAYGFHVLLGDVGSTVVRPLEGLDPRDMDFPVYEPSPLANRNFAAAPLLAGSESEADGELTVESVSGELDRLRVRGHLQLRTPTLWGKTDVVEISIHQARPIPLSLRLFGFVSAATADGIDFTSFPCRPSSAEALKRSVGSPIVARIVFRPRPHVPCDIESLGLILMATLTASSEQRPEAVTGVARRASRALRDLLEREPLATAERVEQLALSIVARELDAGAWAPRHLFDVPSQHAAATAIPAGLWSEALTLALRAITNAPGFGYCRGYDHFDPRHPEVPVDHLCLDLAALIGRIDAVLFGQSSKKAILSSAIRQLRTKRGEA